MRIIVKEKITVALNCGNNYFSGLKSEELQFTGNIYFDDNVKMGYFPFSVKANNTEPVCAIATLQL